MFVIEKIKNGKNTLRPMGIVFIGNNTLRRLLMSLSDPFVILAVYICNSFNELSSPEISRPIIIYEYVYRDYWNNPMVKNKNLNF